MEHPIWTYWHQGFESAPFLVKQCIRQLKHLHPGITIHLLDKDNVYDYAERVPVKEFTWSKMSLPHRSDLLRTQLLIKHGGVWVDPSVYCLLALQDWLPEYMENGLFFFQRPGKDRIISNWFIAAEKDNYFLKKLYGSLLEYWNEHDFRNLGQAKQSKTEYWCKRIINNRSLMLSQLWLTPLFTKVLRLYPYMIYHYMFYYLIRTDPKCKSIFENMPKVLADGPVFVKRKGFDATVNENIIQWIINSETPLFKLDWKTPIQKLPQSSLIHSLLNNKLQK